MGSVVNLLDYKKSRVTNSLSFSYTTEEELASQILKMFNYDNQNIAIPIVKVSKHCGLKVYHNIFYSSDILAKILIGGITEARYFSREVILVNSNSHLFEQRVSIARLLGYYLAGVITNESFFKQGFLLSESLYSSELYDKYIEFVLNILAPSEIFRRQYEIAVDAGLSEIGIYTYLSRFFEVPNSFIQYKVKSLNISK